MKCSQSDSPDTIDPSSNKQTVINTIFLIIVTSLKYIMTLRTIYHICMGNQERITKTARILAEISAAEAPGHSGLK
jgi:hypothetical protein